MNERMPPGIAARIGTGLHKGSEYNHTKKMITGIDEPESVICDVARDSYVSACMKGVFFPPEEVSASKKNLAQGIDTTVGLARLYRKKLAPRIFPEYVEQEIWMPSDFGIPYRGTLDILTTDEWLPDIKTAGARWGVNKVFSYFPQYALYPELVYHYAGFMPKKISFEVFVKNKTPVHQSVEVDTEYHRQNFINFNEKVGIMLQMIKAGIFPPAESGHWKCSPKWCGYFWTCRYIPEHRKNHR